MESGVTGKLGACEDIFAGDVQASREKIMNKITRMLTRSITLGLYPGKRKSEYLIFISNLEYGWEDQVGGFQCTSGCHVDGGIRKF